MAQQDAFALGRSDLNGFLFADIGIEGSGMPLSVISALARQGMDPWQEAGRLAKLPRIAATDWLARLIAAMPASLWPMPDAAAIADRLVGLLPRHAARTPDSRSVIASSPVRADRLQANGPWLIVAVLVVSVLMGVAAYVAPPATQATQPQPAATAPSASVPTGN